MNLSQQIKAHASAGTLTVDVLADLIYEEAYIRACEADSPNSPDFDKVVEYFEEELTIGVGADLLKELTT